MDRKRLVCIRIGLFTMVLPFLYRLNLLTDRFYMLMWRLKDELIPFHVFMF
jgi:hypothetical protein